MKKQIEAVVKQYIREELLKTRNALNISQAEMARRLEISSRAYTNLEGGKCCCSSVTLFIYLTNCCPDQEAFMEGLKAALDQVKADVA